MAASTTSSAMEDRHSFQDRHVPELYLPIPKNTCLMELSILIVNYKTPALVIDCLRTVYAQTSGAAVDYEVIIIDNASGDNSRQLIQTAYPDTRWIQMDYNAGFARAN